MKRPIANSLIPIVAMVFILAISTGMDRGILYLRELNGRTASYIQLTLVSYSAAHLLLAVLLLALFAWIVLRSEAEPWVAWIFLVVGLVISGYPILYFTPIGDLWRFGLLPTVEARSFLITAGSFIAVTGMGVLLRNRPRGTVHGSQGANH